MDTLREILLIVTNALLIPDIIFLLTFSAVVILYLGGLTAEVSERWRSGRAFQRFVTDLKASPERQITLNKIPLGFGFIKKLFTRLKGNKGAVDKELDDIQLDMETSLDRLNLGIRLGPMLGLAGTLIPLGPSFIVLSKGDIVALSNNLVVAFTTAVLGLFVGGVCYAIRSIRRHWYTKDLNDLEFVVRRISVLPDDSGNMKANSHTADDSKVASFVDSFDKRED